MKLGRRVRFAGRGRERSWWLLLPVVLAAVLWAIAQVLGWPVWARAVLAVLAVAVPLIIAELQARFGQDDTRKRLVEQRVTVTVEQRLLPLVRDVELKQLGVHDAQVLISYIERDQQAKLEAAVGPGRAVLLVGHSMSGKTRLAAEVVRLVFPDAPLVIAESGKALRELFDGGLDPAGIVVWLENLELFLGVDGLTVGLLNRLITGRAIVVATIRRKERERYRPSDELRELRPAGWEVVQQFNEISLQRRLTDLELDQVRAMVNDPSVLDAVDHYGLAEYLGAGPDALDKFEKGETENPVGHALVRIAVDWRRTGLTRPVSELVLTTMLPTYLIDRPDVPRTSQAIDEGLKWATKKINETVALLGQVFTGSNEPVFEAFDYLIDQFTPTNTPVPDPMWAFALEQAESAELNTIGWVAYQADKLATAEAAWRQAAEEGDEELAPRAALSLGMVLEKQGDLEGAKTAFQQAIDSGDVERASIAAFALGALREKLGDLEGAKTAYQQALDSGHTKWALPAALSLGALLEKQGDLEGAKAAFQRAIDSGDVEQTPFAAFSLGMVLKKQGDLEGAKTAYQRTIHSGNAEWAPIAMYSRGRLLKEQGDLEGTKIAYQQALDSGDVEWAPRAALSLGILLEKQGDLEGAKTAYQQAIDSGHTKWASKAALKLQGLREKRDDGL